MEEETFSFTVFEDQLGTAREEGPGSPDIAGRLPPELPTLTVFGLSEELDLTVALTVTGYLPYFYVKVEEIADSFRDPLGAFCSAKLTAFAGAIEAAFSSVYRAQPVVHSAAVERHFDFYGFNRDKQAFVKLFLYGPKQLRKVADLLQKGLVGGHRFKCYEVHFDYNVKFYRDCQSGGFQALRIPARLVRAQLEEAAGALGKGRWDRLLNSGKRTACDLELSLPFSSLVVGKPTGRPASAIAHTRTLGELWQSTNDELVRCGLPAVEIGPEQSLGNSGSTGQMGVDEFAELMAARAQGPTDSRPTGPLDWVDSEAVKQYKADKKGEESVVWRNLGAKFQFYKQRSKREKELLQRHRFDDSDDRDSLDSDDEMTVAGDRLLLREKLLKLPLSVENRFDNCGNLREVPRKADRRSANFRRTVADRATRYREPGRVPARMAPYERLAARPPSKQEATATTPAPVQYPYLDCYWDVREHLPVFHSRYSLQFRKDCQRRERRGLFSDYFLQRLSRFCLEDKGGKFAISIRNDRKLPYFMAPQHFDVDSEAPGPRRKSSASGTSQRPIAAFRPPKEEVRGLPPARPPKVRLPPNNRRMW